jgi:hypothetical protein
MIGGFILSGGDTGKTVIIRAIGPSLTSIPGVLQDPILELHKPDGTVVVNDDWKATQQSEIEATGLEPANDMESAIIASLPPVDPGVAGSGLYTAIVTGKNNGTGVALVEVYDLDDPNSTSYLGNISTRGLVGTGDNVMIGGFIIGEGGHIGQVLVRAIGPSLTTLPGALQDPTLMVFNDQGMVVMLNDNWQDTNAGAIEATGLAPKDPRESAVLADLPPGAYTAMVQGVGGTTGVGLVEVYYLP